MKRSLGAGVVVTVALAPAYEGQTRETYLHEKAGEFVFEKPLTQVSTKFPAT